jgi:anti-anti-sigma factor
MRIFRVLRRQLPDFCGNFCTVATIALRFGNVPLGTVSAVQRAGRANRILRPSAGWRGLWLPVRRRYRIHQMVVSDSMSTLTYELYGDALLATFNGPVTRHNAPGYQEELVSAFEPARSVILDLSDVDDISGTGFRMLLHLYHLACSRSGEMALVGLNEELHATVEATGFSEFFVVCDTLDEAIEKVCRESKGHASLR